MYLVVKLTLTAALVVLVSEIARRSTFAGALLASLPLVSLLALVWLYAETGDVERVARLSSGIFWLVLPSLLLFLLLPRLLAAGVPFYASLLASAGVTAAGYLGLVALLKRAGVAL